MQHKDIERKTMKAKCIHNPIPLEIQIKAAKLVIKESKKVARKLAEKLKKK